MKSRILILLGVLALLVAACSSGGASTAPSAAVTHRRRSPRPRLHPLRRLHRPRPLSNSPIYGAASLKGALDAAKKAYETANPGVTLVISTDASSALETKIEQGAPADVFLSADTTNPKKLVDAGLTVGPAVNFAGNKLTVIVPTGEPGQDHDTQGPGQPRRQDHRRG